MLRVEAKRGQARHSVAFATSMAGTHWRPNRCNAPRCVASPAAHAPPTRQTTRGGFAARQSARVRGARKLATEQGRQTQRHGVRAGSDLSVTNAPLAQGTLPPGPRSRRRGPGLQPEAGSLFVLAHPCATRFTQPSPDQRSARIETARRTVCKGSGLPGATYFPPPTPRPTERRQLRRNPFAAGTRQARGQGERIMVAAN